MVLKAIVGRTTPGDRCLVAALLILGCVMLLVVGRSAPGTRVVIRVDDKVVYTAPLNDERHVDIPGPLGSTRVGIVNGAVAVEQASCPQRICMGMTPASKAGDMVACVPNRLLIVVEGNPVNGEERYDLLSR
ncbi:MAG: hypothetical protein C0616_01620 [Desulfuromonas sp.]|nr:MAG: hypothetical protein C0616_01620 [Desulfuromonas sp.]